MKVLVVGGGGREHALAWKLSREAGRREVAVRARATPGSPRSRGCSPISAGDVDGARAAGRARARSISPSSDRSCRSIAASPTFSAARGLRIFGPTRAAAQLECSKVFAKDVHGAPRHPDGALSRLRHPRTDARRVVASGELGFPVVVKADGLAAGKGVVVARDRRGSARTRIRDAMDERQFGDAGSRVVLEECLTGPEVSFFALCDGTPRGAADDRRRITSASSTVTEGPNTGGMGAFAPSPLVDDAMQARIMREIVDPVIAGMRADGHRLSRLSLRRA